MSDQEGELAEVIPLYPGARIDTLLDQIQEHGFESLNAQSTVMTWIARAWSHGMSTDQRDRARALLIPLLDRLQGLAPDHQARLFNRIVHLKSEVQIKRAVEMPAQQVPRYEPEAEEGLYLAQEGWLGDYLTYARHNHIPLAFHFWVGVAIIGAAARRNVFLDFGNDQIWLNHYLFLV